VANLELFDHACLVDRLLRKHSFKAASAAEGALDRKHTYNVNFKNIMVYIYNIRFQLETN